VGQNVAVLVNPTAGKGRAAQTIARAVGRLRDGGCSVALLVGRDAGEALTLARTAVADGADAVVALGGDGMVHLGLQVVAGTDVPLGIVAAGTGNDLAHCLGLPTKDPVAAAGVAADALAAGAARRIDAVRAGGKWFGNVLGAGFDSRVNDRTNRMRWPAGRARYNLAILAELGVFRPVAFRLDLDGEQLDTEATLVAVGNGVSYGAGMRITPDAVVDDGLLDVTIIPPVGRAEFLRLFPGVYSGTFVRHPKVVQRRARVVGLDAPDMTAYADGEHLAPLPVTCECVPGALRVLGAQRPSP
jgi:diacylglycerol kinase (ATP)